MSSPTFLRALLAPVSPLGQAARAALLQLPAVVTASSLSAEHRCVVAENPERFFAEVDPGGDCP